MTIGERIRYFRKDVQKMTQGDFAKKINISQSNIANVEKGRISVTDRVLSDICNTFSLSEEWLRTGEGSMYQETDTTLFAAFAKRYALTEEEQAVARYLLALSSEERQAVLHHVLALSDTVRALKFDRNGNAAPVEDRPPDHRMTMEERHALIMAEMEAEKEAAKKAETSAPSMRSNGIV